MKILHVNWQIWGPHFTGGHVRHVEALIAGLSKLPAVEQSYLYTSERRDDSGEYIEVTQTAGLTIVEVKNNPINSWVDLPLHDLENSILEDVLRTVLTRTRPDIVHVHHLIQFPLRLIDIVREELGLPVVLTVRDYWYVCKVWNLLNQRGTVCPTNNDCGWCHECFEHVSGLPSPTAVAVGERGDFAVRKQRYLAALERCEALTFVSRYLRDQYATVGLSGGNSVVRGGGSPFPFAGPRTVFNARRNVAFLGHASAYKGVDFVLESLSGWRGPPFTLHLWGGAENAERLGRLCARSAVPVVVYGPYERHQVPALLAEVDLGLVPSICPDTAPMTVREFFACGIPVLASRIGGIPEAVRDNRNGLLFEPGDPVSFLSALQRLVADDLLLRRLAAGIRPPKTDATYAREIHQIYASSLERGSGGALADLPSSLDDD